MNLDRNFREIDEMSRHELVEKVAYFYPDLYNRCLPPPRDVHIMTLKEDHVARRKEAKQQETNTVSVVDRGDDCYEVIEKLAQVSGFIKVWNLLPAPIRYGSNGNPNLEPHFHFLIWEWVVENKLKHDFWFL